MNDVSQWMRQTKTITRWEASNRERLVIDYVETPASDIEKLKRFTARVVDVGVLYQKPLFKYQAEDNG